MTVRELIRAAGLRASALRPGNLSGGVAASLAAVHGPPGPEPAGRRGDPEVAPKEGRRSTRRSCSPSTTLRPARSSARADDRCSVRACWRAVKVTNRSNRCARIAQRRRWNHHPSWAKHSTHPVPLGGTAVLVELASAIRRLASRRSTVRVTQSYHRRTLASSTRRRRPGCWSWIRHPARLTPPVLLLPSRRGS